MIENKYVLIDAVNLVKIDQLAQELGISRNRAANLLLKHSTITFGEKGLSK